MGHSKYYGLSFLGKKEIGPQGRDILTYSYDAAGRLAEVRKNELLSEHYLYDESGRRIQDFRAWAGERRTLTYYYTGELIQAGDTHLEWTTAGKLSSMERGGQKMRLYYGHDTRLERAILANGTDIRYHYRQEILPVKIEANGHTVGEYQWQDGLRLVHSTDDAGLSYEFAYGAGRLPVQRK